MTTLGFPQVRTVCCVPYDTITPVSRHVLSVSRALYMELHFHVLVIVRRDYHFRIKGLQSRSRHGRDDNHLSLLPGWELPQAYLRQEHSPEYLFLRHL